MSSKRKNIPMKLSPTMPKSVDDGSFKPDTINDRHVKPLHVDVNSYPYQQQRQHSQPTKRNSVDNSSSDSQTSPPESKKSRVSSSTAGSNNDKVIDSVKKAVLSSELSLNEKQETLSKMIAELQNLQKNLAHDKQVKLQVPMHHNSCQPYH